MGGTIWEDVGKEEGGAELGSDAMAHLKVLFQMKKGRAAAARGGGAGGATAPVVKVVTVNRANNVSIMLTQFKGIAPEDLRKGIFTVDPELLSLERLGILLQISPTDDECRAFQDTKEPFASLSPPEQVLSTLAAVPRLKLKLQCLIFIKQWPTRAEEFRTLLKVVSDAYAQIRGSAALKRAFKWYLHVGNVVNAHSNRGNARGVRLDSLLKATDVKVTKALSAKEATDERSRHLAKVKTLLDFMALSGLWGERAAAEAEGGAPGDLFMTGELRTVGQAAGHSQAELEDYAGQMDKGLALVRDEVRKALDSAALELEFGRALERLVGPVVEDRARLATESQAVIEEVKKLGTFLGEKPEVPPEDIFRGVWRFAQQWDRSMKKFAPPSSGKRPRSA